jgi:hypothetical protein
VSGMAPAGLRTRHDDNGMDRRKGWVTEAFGLSYDEYQGSGVMLMLNCDSLRTHFGRERLRNRGWKFRQSRVDLFGDGGKIILFRVCRKGVPSSMKGGANPARGVEQQVCGIRGREMGRGK